MPEKVSNNLSRTFHWRKRHWNRLFAKDEVMTADLLDTPRPIEENKTGHPSWQENEVVLVDIWGEFLDSRCLQSLVIWIHLSIFQQILAITQKLGTCHVWNTLLDTFGYPFGPYSQDEFSRANFDFQDFPPSNRKRYCESLHVVRVRCIQNVFNLLPFLQ